MCCSPPCCTSRGGPAGFKGAAFLGATLAAFLVVAGRYLRVMLIEGQTTKDYNFRFDNFTDPAYYLMWRTDMPGKVGEWPLPGEYGGVGLFALLTFVCLGAAIWLGIRTPMVVTIAAMFISAWVMRMYIASNMYETQTVQLYTRTNNQLLYCGLLLSALLVHLVAQRMAARRADSGTEAELQAGAGLQTGSKASRGTASAGFPVARVR